ncbi:MAG TPA: L,D-transpeptidase family protein [Chitinophagaceae bacterium]|nr:L,D-transpeptidase family protein [Chitinophagaceae bacterium]
MIRFAVLLVFTGLCCSFSVRAQTSAPDFNFVNYQRSFPVFNDALKRKEDTLIKQFEVKKLQWPARYMYIRSFKYDSQLEVWVKQEKNDPYKLFKTYKVCALAGTLGPKRMAGDYQVPEGFYYINEFNPRSTYHLSLGLNYPNASDRMLSDSLQPGGDIYIHGSCVTTGCIPITDTQIEELYILATQAKNQGEDFIPVHIFPISFKNARSNDYLSKYIHDFPEYRGMAEKMKQVFFYFEKHKNLPVIMVNDQGEYVFGDDVKIANEEVKVEVKTVKRKEATPVKFDMSELENSVNKLPVFQGGAEAFQKFLDNLSKDLVKLLPEDQKKTFITVEYIVNKEGKTILPKVLRGATNEMNNLIIERFEAMPLWSPAIRLEKPIAIRLKQTIYVEAD